VKEKNWMTIGQDSAVLWTLLGRVWTLFFV